MEEHDRALALGDLAAAIEQALNTSLPRIVQQAHTHDRLTERLLQRNLLQLSEAAAQLREAAAQLHRVGNTPLPRPRAATAMVVA